MPGDGDGDRVVVEAVQNQDDGVDSTCDREYLVVVDSPRVCNTTGHMT